MGKKSAEMLLEFEADEHGNRSDGLADSQDFSLDCQRSLVGDADKKIGPGQSCCDIRDDKSCDKKRRR